LENFWSAVPFDECCFHFVCSGYALDRARASEIAPAAAAKLASSRSRHDLQRSSHALPRAAYVSRPGEDRRE
jgi:hypothetical protein